MSYLLAFNNEPVDLTDSSHPATKVFNKCMEQFGDFKKGQDPLLSFPIEMEFTSVYYSPAHQYDKEQPETYCQMMNIPSTVTTSIRLATGTSSQLITGKWTIYENMTLDDKGNKRYMPKSISVEKRRQFENDDETNVLLFFLTFISPHCEILRDDDNKPYLQYQNTQNSSKKYLIRNIRKENKDEAKIKRNSALINKLIWDETNGLEIGKLMQIASVYGVPNSDDKRYIEDIRLALDKMINKNNLNDMLAFLKLVDSESDTEVLATISKAKELELIYVEKGKLNSYWKGRDVDETEVTLCMCKKSEEQDVTLQKELIADYLKYQKLKKIVNNKLKSLDE